MPATSPCAPSVPTRSRASTTARIAWCRERSGRQRSRTCGFPTDSPKRAAVCSLIPGMGAVYNNEYLKALTYFAVFAALVVMSDHIHGIFGFAAFAFIVFTMFDSYRTAEAKARARLETGTVPEKAGMDRTPFAWGIFLVFLGILFLLQNIIPYHFLNRMWPAVFILLGAYLVWRSVNDHAQTAVSSPRGADENKQV